MKPRSRAALLIYLLGMPLLYSESARGQADDIVVDGVFQDWSEIEPVYEDSRDQQSGIDFERLWFTNDSDYIYLSIIVGSVEISIQEEPSFRLYLDTDNDPATGTQFEGIGADLVWSFGELSGTFHGRNGPVSVGHRDIGLISGPTVTSTRFEIAFELDVEPRRQGPLFPEDTVVVALEALDSDDVLPDEGDEVKVIIDRTVQDRNYSFDLGRELDTDLRILAWNVERDALFDPNKTSSYSSILQALDPDIIGFSEIIEHDANETIDRVEELYPSPPGEQWFGSGSSFDIVILSRSPILRSFELIDRGAGQGSLIDLSARGGNDLFFATAHLRCCEANAQRQRQIDEMMAWIRDAQTDGTIQPETPIVVVGDMNFVGDSQQLRTLIEGDIVNGAFQPSFDPDWNGEPLVDAAPPTTGVPAAYTWPGNGQDFPPGRLDFVAYTGSVLEPGNMFSLHTPAMPFTELQRYGLGATATLAASDHLPLVVDVRGSSVTSSESAGLETGGLQIDVYPNPATEIFTVSADNAIGGIWRLRIVDILGRTVFEREQAFSGVGPLRFRSDRAAVAPGVYFVRLTSESSKQHGSSPFILD